MRMSNDRGGGSSRVFRKQLADSSLKSSAPSMTTTLPRPRRLEGETGADLAHHIDGELQRLGRPGGEMEIRMAVRVDLQTSRTMVAGIQRPGGLFAQKRRRQLGGEQPFAHAGRANEEVGVSQSAARHHLVKSVDQGVMPAHALPAHGPPSSSSSLATSRCKTVCTASSAGRASMTAMRSGRRFASARKPSRTRW